MELFKSLPIPILWWKYCITFQECKAVNLHFSVAAFLFAHKTSATLLYAFLERNKVDLWHYRFNIHSLHFQSDPKVPGYIFCWDMDSYYKYCKAGVKSESLSVREPSRGTRRHIQYTFIVLSSLPCIHFIEEMLSRYSWIWGLTISLEGLLTNREGSLCIKKSAIFEILCLKQVRSTHFPSLMHSLSTEYNHLW